MRTDIKQRDLNQLAEYRELLRKKPRLIYLFLELTDRCNMNCMHCGSNCSPQKSHYLDIDAVMPVLHEVKSRYGASSVMICLTGGEPLLHPGFCALVRQIHALGFPWGITTNATLIDEKILEVFQETGLKSVTLSLDGLEKTNDAFRRCKGAFHKILDKINLLSSNGIAVQITTVVHKQNLDELEGMYDLISTLNVASWRLVNLEPIGRALEHPELQLSGEDYKALFAFIREKRYFGSRRMETTYGCSHYLTPRYERELRDTYFICGSGIYVASILCNGDIFSCLDIERRPELIQGNINRDSFVDVWEHGFEPFRQDRTVLSKKCSTCDERFVCGADSTHTWNFEKNEPYICIKSILEDKNDDLCL